MNDRQQSYFPTGRPEKSGDTAGINPQHLAIAELRLRVLQAFFDALAERHISHRGIGELNIPGFGRPTTSSIWRWRERYQRDGFLALVPKYSNCGRKPKDKSE